jgi:hypothetical protein
MKFHKIQSLVSDAPSFWAKFRGRLAIKDGINLTNNDLATRIGTRFRPDFRPPATPASGATVSLVNNRNIW